MANTPQTIYDPSLGCHRTVLSTDTPVDGNNNPVDAGTFADGTLKQNNVAGTFATTLRSLATAARLVSFPDAAGTLALLGLAQLWTAIQTFGHQLIKINNAAATFATRIGSLATANRDVNFPDAAGTVLVSGGAQIVTGDVAPATLKGANIDNTKFATFFCGLGVDASGAPANTTATGVASGDKVLAVINLTDLTMVTSSFAATANGTNTIQQTATNLSAKKLLFIVLSNA